MNDGEQVPLRQRLCRAQVCGAVFYVCRYCSQKCRDKARREQRRAANRRHQRSEEGRLDHRDRQREYRQRLVLLRVTDQGSDEPAWSSTLAALSPPPGEPAGGEAICCVCSRRGTLVDPFTG
jgi:hypothetical protein